MTSAPHSRRATATRSYLVGMACLTATYFLAGKAGLALASVNASATAVWPPTGIAVAALLLFGRRLWPGVALGAFLVNLATSGSLLASVGIAVGNTLEAVAAVWMINRWAGGVHAFDRAPDVFRFSALAGLIATGISATIGISSLLIAGLATREELPQVWLTWWLGDAGGAVIVAPALVLACTDRRPWERRETIEACLLLVALTLITLAVFGGATPFSVTNYPLGFLCIPLVLWPALRLGQRETALCMIVLAAIATWGTLRGYGPFGLSPQNEALLLVQTFTGVVGVTAAAMAALVAEQRRLYDQLEKHVSERTEQLRASEARLLEAQQVAHVGSWEWHVAKNKVWWSEELYRIYGLEAPRQTMSVASESYEGFLERVHPDDREPVKSAVAASLATGQPFALEHRIVRSDGTARTVLARGRVMVNLQGRPERMLGTAHDITERRSAEEEHRQLLEEQAARRQAEAANRMKDEFLAMISHELRTPLNTVLGWTHMLSAGSLDAPAATKALQTIERNAHAQARLIDDLLDVSRFAAGQIRLRRQAVNIASIVRMVLETIEPIAGARGIRIDANLDGAGASVDADPERLQQIVWNLLSNAVKFTPDGGSVAVRAVGTNDTVELLVKDTGRGLDAAELQRVFEPFWQADTTTTRAHGGLGLGLAIVRYLAEAHGGRVRAYSGGPGQGASFIVELPRHAIMPASP